MQRVGDEAMIGSKPPRIVAIEFEGGERWELREAPSRSESDRIFLYLIPYIERLGLQWNAYELGLDPAEGPYMPAAWRSYEASERAKKFRKYPDATPGAIRDFIKEWIASHPHARSGRGSITAAAAHFNCPEDVISRRLKLPDPA
jgi:hypothetical protein